MAMKKSSTQSDVEAHRDAQHMDAEGKSPESTTKKPFILKRWWTALELDVPTLLMMGKAALPPAIALSLIQVDSYALHFTTLAYLVAIASVLGLCIMPRAKFLQTMITNTLMICLATAIVLLEIYCAVKAREHTSPPLTSAVVPYNSSASAVCAVWLFFLTWLLNTIRAKYPQFTINTVLVSIFVNVASSYAPIFPNMTAGVSFAKRLIEAFLTGFAIAAGVSLVIMPLTSRTIVFKEMTGYISLLRASLKAHGSYLGSLKSKEWFHSESEKTKAIPQRRMHNAEARTLHTTVQKLIELHAKLFGDLPFAKREIAMGYLGPDDLTELFRLLRTTMLPVVSLGSVAEMFGRLQDLDAWNNFRQLGGQGIADKTDRDRVINEWSDVMTAVHPTFQSLLDRLDEGLEHTLLTLKLIKPAKKPKKTSADTDVEEMSVVKPGDEKFTEYLEAKVEEFSHGKELGLRKWCEEKGIDLPPDFFKHPSQAKLDNPDVFQSWIETSSKYRTNQRQLFMLLYIDYLLFHIGQSIISLSKFADSKKDKLVKRRLVVPGYKRMRKWLLSLFDDSDTSADDRHMDESRGGCNWSMGSAYKERRSPEHLPPATAFEKFGNMVRTIPAVLKSSESSFGFRVACATMSIGIVNFLADTQMFFLRQRLLWAMIMVALSMSPTSGQATFQFALRSLGTLIAVVASFLVYYIPDGHTAGIIVFTWLAVALGSYILLKQPRFLVVGLISMVTVVLIIGYELCVRKIGEEAIETNGQPAYPIYLLAPYRLATVVGGLLIAYIWTVFPYPTSEHSALRQSLGGSLYLLANYYSIVHETVKMRLNGYEGDPDDKTSPGRRIEKERNRVFGKQTLLLSTLRQLSAFTKWEVPLGGKFPREQYDKIIGSIQNIHGYMSLISFASATYTRQSSALDNDTSDLSRSLWFSDFRKIMQSPSLNFTSHEITSLLSLLSSSITNGQPLPPYLAVPQPYKLTQRLEELDHDILSVRHIAEPGYAAFAVMQLSSRCVIEDLDILIKNVKELVGELDFSFHVVSTKDGASDTLMGSRSSGEGDEKGKKAD